MPDMLERPAASRLWSAIATGAVPARARGRWCILSSPMDQTQARRHATRVLVFEDDAGEDAGPRHHLRQFNRPGGRIWRAVVYVPADAVGYGLHGRPGSSHAHGAMRFVPIPRWAAASAIMTASADRLPRMLRALVTGGPRQARTLLTLIASSTPGAVDYAEWQQCFDSWPAQAPEVGPGWPSIAGLVFADATASAALRATEAALAAQSRPMPQRSLLGSDAAAWRDAVAALESEYVAILQAGEVLPPHAHWAVASELHRLGRPALAYGDEDRLGADGVRSDPNFRPEPNRALMLSGTLSRGAWFVRRDVLLSYAGEAGGWAEAVRLDVWLRRFEAGSAGGHRIPVILTHRRDDAESAPAPMLAGLVDGHLARSSMKLATRPGFPIVVRCTEPTRDRVAILVPSRLMTALTRRSILSVATDLRGRDVELIVGVSQPGPLNETQSAMAAEIAAFPHAHVAHLPAASFNFSAVCNALAARTTGRHILLLNDDVSVLETGWLDEMVAHLGDPAVGIVGAKLLYPDRSVQHGGVLIGLSGLCDHISRHLQDGEPDPSGRVDLAQELSAVTAACLLVRRTVFDQLGGLDVSYPSAFNDVDFCLRAREAGHRIVYAPAATLMHHELQTYGSHYGGDRAPFHTIEVARMRRRWAELLANDPFHNPNLDLVAGREWQPCFPPRFALHLDGGP